MRTTENDDYLITTFPIVDMNNPATSPMVFPQIADGGGYVTEIFLLSPGQTEANIDFFGETGDPLAIGN